MDEQHLAGIMAAHHEAMERIKKLEPVVEKAQVMVNVAVTGDVARVDTALKDLARALNEAGVRVAL